MSWLAAEPPLHPLAPVADLLHRLPHGRARGRCFLRLIASFVSCPPATRAMLFAATSRLFFCCQRCLLRIHPLESMSFGRGTSSFMQDRANNGHKYLLSRDRQIVVQPCPACSPRNW